MASIQERLRYSGPLASDLPGHGMSVNQRHPSELDIEAADLIDLLIEALRPFANAWERFEASVDIDDEWLRNEIADGVIWGDLRKALSALEKAEGK